MTINLKRSRRRATALARRGVADDEPVSSVLALLAVVVAVGLAARQAGVTELGPARSPGWILVGATVSGVALWGLAKRFARRTLRIVTIVLVLLFALAMLGLGESALGDKETKTIMGVVDSLNVQLADLDVPVPDAKARKDAADAVAALRVQVSNAAAGTPTARLVPVLDALDTLLTGSAATPMTLQKANALLDTLAGEAAANEAPQTAAIAAAKKVAAQVGVAVGATAVRVSEERRLVAQMSINSLARASRAGGKPVDLAVPLALARRDVARAVAAAQSGNKDAAQATTDADKAYLTALEHPRQTGTTIADTFSAAGEKLIGLKVVGTDGMPFDPGLVGWLLLAGLLIVGYRALEARTGQGELLLAARSAAAGTDKHPEYSERFRTYVSRNIPEPAAVPAASSTLKPVTDLLTAATGAAALTGIGKLISGAVDTLKAPRGMTASLTVLADYGTDKTEKAGPAAGGEPKAMPPMVAVRVSAQASGVQLLKTFRRATIDEALRTGAYWAAATLMEGSRRVPEWALWSPDACDSLAEFHAAVDIGRPPSLTKLKEAVASAPRSGLLLVELANQHAVEGHLAEAFAYNLRALSLYPRWPVARYRLAATAIMLADKDGGSWRSADDAQRSSIGAALRRSNLAGSIDLAAALKDGAGFEQRRALCLFAIGLLDPAKTVGFGHVLWNAMRATERSYWCSLLRARDRMSYRAQFTELAESARAIARVRRRDGTVDLDAWNGEDDLTWQLAYNLACARSERAAHPTAGTDQAAEIASALDWLELAVTRPGGHQLTREWLEHDPDLAILRNHARFAYLAQQLPKTRDDEGSVP